MSFAAPLMLLGLALLGLPWWLHRLRTDSAQSEPFSSVQLLEAARQRVFVDRKIRYWLLLMLRLLLLALGVLLVARPVLTDSTPLSEDEVEHWLLVDTSVSMTHPANADTLPRAVSEVLEAIPLGQPVGLLSNNGQLQILATVQQPRSQVREAALGLVDDLMDADAGVTLPLRQDVGELVAAVGDLLGRRAAGSVVHFISDFQASAMPGQFSRAVPRAPYDLRLYPIPAADNNGFVASVQVSESQLTVAAANLTAPAALRVQVGEGPVQTRELTPDRPGAAFELTLLPQENPVRIMLDDAGVQADNTYHLLVDRSPPDMVPLLTAEGRQGNRFLTTAVAAVNNRAALVPTSFAEFDSRALSRYRWLVVEDLGLMPPGLVADVRPWLQAGGRMLAGAGAAALGMERLPLTAHPLRVPELGDEALMETDRPAGGQPITGANVDHPLLDLRLPWENILVSRSLNLDLKPDDRALLWITPQQPFVLEHTVGAGRVLLVNGGFDRRWNDWPTRPSFVPFIAAAGDYLAGYQGLGRQRLAGETLVLPPNEQVTYELVAPGAATGLFGRPVGPAGAGLTQLGFYTLHGSNNSVQQIAVNVDPRESDLSPLEPALMARWQGLLAEPRTNAQVLDGSAAADMDPQHPLLLWLLVALLLAVFSESLVGNLMMRKPV